MVSSRAKLPDEELEPFHWERRLTPFPKLLLTVDNAPEPPNGRLAADKVSSGPGRLVRGKDPATKPLDSCLSLFCIAESVHINVPVLQGHPNRVPGDVLVPANARRYCSLSRPGNHP